MSKIKYHTLKTINYQFYSYFYLFLIFIFLKAIECQAKDDLAQSLIYYDANDILINKNEETILLNGEATFFLGKIYLSANKIYFNKKTGILNAEGEVKLINNKQKAIASRLLYDANTKQFRLDNAQIFSDPEQTEQRATEETLNISKAEIAFDSAKNKRIKELESELKKLREEYVNAQNIFMLNKRNNTDIEEKLKKITQKYSRMLGRLTRTQHQPNAILENLPENIQKKILDRRIAVEKFNAENPEMVNQINNFSMIKGYVYVSAEQIIQKDPNNFILNNAIMTPCKCSPYNEPAIYGFSTKNATIEVGDYISMHNVTFDLFSVPVFYLPWLSFPIKNKRETGFLFPSGYMSNNAGQAISIPLFVTFGEHADSTLTYEYFSARGSQFSGDFRIQFTEESQLKAENKFIKDKVYQNEYLENSANIDAAIVAEPGKTKTYNNYRGKESENRWYSGTSFNTLFFNHYSFKSNLQFVSDNNYLSDFSSNNLNTNPLASVFGDRSSASRRFLNKEFDVEYYGENSVLSIRAQGMQDLFADDLSQTPTRMPKIEHHLLPFKLFETSFIFHNYLSFENMERPNGQIFIPINDNTSSPQGSNNTVITSQKQANDPYVIGQRLHNSAELILPFPSNDYFNANFNMKAVGTQYYFPTVTPYKSNKPYMGFLGYGAHLDIPMYGKLKISHSENNTSLIQNFVPFVDFDYIPNAKISEDFPNTYQLWYADDNILRKAVITIGATNSWTIKQEKYVVSQRPINRLPTFQDPGVANLQYFKAVVTDKKIKKNSIYDISKDPNAHQLFEAWAKKELNDYFTKVNKYEFEQNYIWPEGNFYQKQILWSMTPLSLTISAGYNILSEATAEDANKRAGPSVATIPVQKYTDITASANLNLNPIFPFDSVFTISYSPFYERINSTSFTNSLSLPFGFKGSYNSSQQFVISPINDKAFIQKTQESYDLTYSPLNWLMFGYQWAKSTDPSADPSTDYSGGRDYASSQNVSLLNLQGCLDLIFSRNKPAGTPENQSTYAISLNLKIFGYERRFDQVGESVNRRLQN